MKVGEIISTHKEIEINKGRRTCEIAVVNCGDRPIQVGSHFHFFEVNKQLAFNREMAYGMKLDIPSGNSVRFEPGETKKVVLCEFGGNKKIYGLNNLTCGEINEENKKKALEEVERKGF